MHGYVRNGTHMLFINGAWSPNTRFNDYDRLFTKFCMQMKFD